MKILGISLNGDPVSRFPNKYGGAGRSIRLMMDGIKNFYLVAEESCFEGDINERCIPITHEQIENIRNNKPISDIVKDNFDLILVNGDTNSFINTTIKQICWCGGFNEKVHPRHEYMICYHIATQCPIFQNDEKQLKVYEFRLGTPLPIFEKYKKEPFILQITNHYHAIQSHMLALVCNKYGIKCIFGGPIDINYQDLFLKCIDNQNTYYLGMVKENDKIKLLKRATFFASLYSYPLHAVSLAFKQALSYGCGILTTPGGQTELFMRDKNIGFLVKNADDLIRSWIKKGDINQENCYNAVKNN